MKKIFLLSPACLLLLTAVARGQEHPTIPLFNGKSFEGWGNKKGQAARGWVVKEGCIYHAAGKGRPAGNDIYTAKEYENFDLRFDWKVGPGGNSGVKYRVADLGKETTGPEYQVLDDSRHPDGENPLTAAGSAYDLYPPDSTRKELSPEGEFNHSRILVMGTTVEHWLNGRKILEYDTSSQDFSDRLAKSKYKKLPGFGQNNTGRIMLQDHGDEVWFCNITIRPL